MNRVDFYILPDTVSPQTSPLERRLLACRLSDKAYQRKHKIYIRGTDIHEANILDSLLWSFRDDSFLPHELHSKESNGHKENVILIGFEETSLPMAYDLLINLSPTIPACFQQFTRVIEIVSPEETARKQARENYRFYRNLRWEVVTSNLS